jgi:hypothetical protein
MTFPTEWKNNPNVPNHQPDDHLNANLYLLAICGKTQLNLVLMFSGLSEAKCKVLPKRTRLAFYIAKGFL